MWWAKSDQNVDCFLIPVTHARTGLRIAGFQTHKINMADHFLWQTQPFRIKFIYFGRSFDEINSG